jgi:hypothetical protein
MVTRDELEMVWAKNVVRAPSELGLTSQEQYNTHTQCGESEEDGTLSLNREAHGSRRVTFALWTEEGTGAEADEGRTKATVTKSEHSLHYMEEASMAK